MTTTFDAESAEPAEMKATSCRPSRPRQIEVTQELQTSLTAKQFAILRDFDLPSASRAGRLVDFQQLADYLCEFSGFCG